MTNSKPRFKVQVGSMSGCIMPANAWCFCTLDQRTLNKHYSSNAIEGVKSHAAELAAKGFQNIADRLLAQLA